MKLPILAQIAKEAGEHILTMRADILANKDWKFKEDGSPFTPADAAANDIVCRRLHEAFPNTPVVSEENSPEENAPGLAADERIDTDPLDNTWNFIEGYGRFSVNIGRIKNGVPTDGAAYFPLEKELYFTGADGKAYLQKGDGAPKRIEVKKFPMRNPLQVAVGYNEQHYSHLGDHPYVTQKAAGQMRTCLVACGECDITGINKGYNGGFQSWDTAGPHAVLLAAGGDIVTPEGVPMRYGKESTTLPNHIAGARDVLIGLRIAQTSALTVGRRM